MFVAIFSCGLDTATWEFCLTFKEERVGASLERTCVHMETIYISQREQFPSSALIGGAPLRRSFDNLLSCQSLQHIHEISPDHPGDPHGEVAICRHLRSGLDHI